MIGLQGPLGVKVGLDQVQDVEVGLGESVGSGVLQGADDVLEAAHEVDVCP